ncbi:hypothetical protein K2X33_14365 [bacterium]|nr:hypothetical protein [bacterium]
MRAFGVEKQGLLAWGTLALALFCAPVWASPADADQSEDRARAGFIDQFSKFMQDKNVQGKAKDPTGKIVQGGRKTRFNADDGLAFQSDLTYHDFSFNSERKVQGTDPNDPNKQKSERLFAFVSAHGAESAAGGSSLLERTAFQLDQKLSKQDDKTNKDDNEKGIRFRSIFKITTRDVFDSQAAQSGATTPANGQKKNNDEEEKRKVDRFELRDEARPEIDKVGEQSAETVIEAARGQGNEKDTQTLGNGVLLRQAAYEATKALWTSTLANLSQRRVNRSIRRGSLDESVQLSEGMANCDEWSNAAQQYLAAEKDPKVREEMQKDMQRMIGQCKEVAALPFNAIGPTYQKSDDGKSESLAFEGPQKEDSFQRDARVQLEVMDRAGISAKDVPANWQYTDKDDQARMTIDYIDGAPKEGSQTVEQQLDSYNQNLAIAEKAYDEVKSRVPGLVNPKPTRFAIQPGTKSLLQINQPPASAFEEVGGNKAVSNQAPQTYEQLLKQSQ